MDVSLITEPAKGLTSSEERGCCLTATVTAESFEGIATFRLSATMSMLLEDKGNGVHIADQDFCLE